MIMEKALTGKALSVDEGSVYYIWSEFWNEEGLPTTSTEVKDWFKETREECRDLCHRLDYIGVRKSQTDKGHEADIKLFQQIRKDLITCANLLDKNCAGESIADEEWDKFYASLEQTCGLFAEDGEEKFEN